MKRGIAGLALAGFMGTALGAFGQEAADLETAFVEGVLKGKIGVFYQNDQRNDEDETDHAAGVLNLKFETAPYRHATFGVEVLGLGELYEDDGAADSFGDYYDTDALDAMLKKLYIDYAFDGGTLTIGRHKTAKPPMLQGDSHEGVTLRIDRWQHQGLKLYATVLTGWIDDAAWDDGVDGWTDMDQRKGGGGPIVAGEDPGEQVYPLMAVWTMHDALTLKPYLIHQADLATVTGMRAESRVDVGGMTVSGTADCYRIAEDLDAPRFVDSTVWMLYGGVKRASLSAGLGYHRFSDVNAGESQLGKEIINGNGTTASKFWIDDLSALEEARLDGDDAATWWVDLGWSGDRLALTGQYGEKTEDNQPDYTEWMVQAEYELTEALGTRIMYVDIEQGGTDRSLLEVSAMYSF